MLKRILQNVCWVGAILMLSSTAWATRPGFYVGLQVGATQTKAKNVQAIVFDTPFLLTVPATPNSSRQFGGRVYLGYKWNCWFAWELGGTIFSFLNYKTAVPTCGTTSVFLGVVDTVLKPSFTLGPFDAYVKGGVAASNITNSAALNQGLGATCAKRTNFWRFGAVVGVGVNYELTQNWVADLAYTRIQVGGNFIQYVDFLSVGISYHIVDTYCGQFLCD